MSTLTLYDMTTEIELKQTNRFRLLHKIYEVSDGDSRLRIDVRECGVAIGLKNGNYEDAYSFLINKDFIEGNGSGHNSIITHLGKDAVEETVTNPSKKQVFWGSYKSMGF